MANKRQKKKQAKKQLVKQVARIEKKEPKAVEKLNYNQLNTIVSQNAKRERKNERERQRRAENRKLIDKYGLQGFKPSDSAEKIKAAAAKAQAEIDKQQRRETKARNEGLLTGANISKENWPKGWTKMSETELQSWIENYQAGNRQDRSKVFQSDTWLYIGWGDRSGNENPLDNFSQSSFYGQSTVDDLRDGIAETVKTKGVDKSSGRAGDTVIAYGGKSEMYAYMRAHEKLGYQTIFFGNEISNHALMRYTAACVDSSPESNREYIVQKVNAYLGNAGYSEYKLKL